MSKVKYIACDICEQRIPDESKCPNSGALAFNASILRYISRDDIDGYGWGFKRVHICRKCLDYIKHMRSREEEKEV